MSRPEELRAEAGQLYATARETKDLNERLKIVLRALELELAADVAERHDRAAA